MQNENTEYQSESPSLPPLLPTVEVEQFFACDLRVGVIRTASPLTKARKPAYRLEIDFGPAIGLKQSSAQLTKRYQPQDLIGKKIVAVVNFPPRRIAGFKSEVLVLGAVSSDGSDVSLLSVDHSDLPPGTKIG